MLASRLGLSLRSYLSPQFATFRASPRACSRVSAPDVAQSASARALIRRSYATEYRGAPRPSPRSLPAQPSGRLRRGWRPPPMLVLGLITAPCVGLTLVDFYARDRAQRGCVKEAIGLDARSDPKLFFQLDKHFTLSLRNMREGRWHTLVTNSFRHGDLWHLGFNMLGLWSFGIGLMQIISPASFLLVYSGGVLAGSTASLINKSRRQAWNGMSYGASAGVLSMVTVSALLQPWSTIYILVIPVPAIIALGGLVAYDGYLLVAGSRGIDSAAHLGGMGFGLAYFARMLMRR